MLNGQSNFRQAQPHRKVNRPMLPAKKGSRTRVGEALQVLQMPPPPPEDLEAAIAPHEAIYDCLPKPRSCLTEQQIQYNAIYDVPRNLLVPKSSSKDATKNAR